MQIKHGKFFILVHTELQQKTMSRNVFRMQYARYMQLVTYPMYCRRASMINQRIGLAYKFQSASSGD